MNLDKMTASELVNKINTTDVTSESFKAKFNDIIRLIKTMDEREEYISKFYAHWTPIYERFDNAVKNLKHISVELWMTDCYDNRDEFADFFYNEQRDLDKTFICADWLITNFNEDAYKVMTLVFGEPYDGVTGIDAFWREDYLRKETDLDELAINLIKADKMIDIFLS